MPKASHETSIEGVKKRKKPRHSKDEKPQQERTFEEGSGASERLTLLAPSHKPAANGGALPDLEDRPKKRKKRKLLQVEVGSAAVPASNAASTALLEHNSVDPSSTYGGQRQHCTQQYSAVGDRNLAQNSPAIRKQLYKEHPDVKQLSKAAVSLWRQQRSTAVEGIELKPVREFSQAGGPAARLMPAVLQIGSQQCRDIFGTPFCTTNQVIRPNDPTSGVVLTMWAVRQCTM